MPQKHPWTHLIRLRHMMMLGWVRYLHKHKSFMRRRLQRWCGELKKILMAKMAIWKFFQFVFRPNSRLIKHMTKKVSCVTTTALFYDIHRRYYYDAMNVANTIWNWLRICFFFPSRTWCPLLVSRSRRENCESKNLWWVKLIIYC